MGLFDKLFGKEEPKAAEEPRAKEEPKAKEEPRPAEVVIGSPLKGQILPLGEVKDEVFSSGMLGKGVAIEPSEGRVVAPVSGELATLFPTKHAVGLRTGEGIEVLIHIGIDTVELNGKYFEAHAAQGQTVKKGDLLVTFDVEKLREEGYVTQVPILITNDAGYTEIQEKASGEVSWGDDLLMLKS